MIEQGLFKRHFVGRDGFQWWIGQVAPEESWIENQPGVPVSNNEDESYKGFGERVRVRIMGYHTESVNDIPDEELPWATVMYPTTAGGGGRSSYQSMNLVGGNFVFGFFLDGEDAQQPVIMGVIGYNDYQEVMKTLTPNDPSPRFVPHSSYDKEQEKDKVPPYSVKEGGAGQTAGQTYSQGTPNNELVIESVQGSNTLKEMSAFEMERKGKVEEPLAQTEDCEPIPTSRIQKEMQNTIREMEFLQRSIRDPRTAISLGNSDIPGQIQVLQKKLARYMASHTKSILQQTEKKVINELNSTAKKTYNTLMPNERPKLRVQMEKSNDKIACLYTNVFDELYDTMDDFLSDLLGTGGSNDTGAKKAINIPICFVNDTVGNTIGSIINELSSELNGSISEINDVLGDFGSASVPSLMNFDWLIDDAFSYFKCEEEPKCPAQETWSAWYGMDTGNNNTRSNAKAISKSSKKTSSRSSDIGSGFSDISFGELYLEGDCGDQEENLGPEVCGPPKVKITGGFGADANAIITQDGKVLAIDVNQLGVNYSDFDARIKIIDKCGNGSGALVEAQVGVATVTDNRDGTITISNGTTSSIITGGRMPDGNIGYYDDLEEPMIPVLDENGDPTPDGGETITIVDGVVLQPGTDYLPAPDGSSGGDGRTWARPDDTIITVNTGGGIGWLPPVPPGVTIPVNPGDTVTTSPTSPIVQPIPLPVPPTTPSPTDPGVGPGTGGPPTPPVDPETGEPIVEPGVGTPDTDPVVPIDDETGLPIIELDPIPPGVPTVITYPSVITTPPSFDATVPKTYPVGSDSTYPVILYLCEIIIQDPGFNYTQDDELVISPDNGASASFKLDEAGRIISVTVDAGGEGFTDIPSIYINSQTGYNATLTPKFCIDRVTDEFKEPAINERLVTVIDCTGRSPNGYLNGKPYYGPYHEHNGVKMVGARHTSLSHSTLTDRP